MVVTNKRKRKDANRIDVSPEIPKRIKVHAQRKFAQGALGPPIVLPIVQPNREEIRPQQTPIDLIPTKRPNTEDFLTFLCFRGTPILPPRLDFFNNAPGVPSTSNEEPLVTSNIQNSSPLPFIPFGVRKRALVYPEKNTSLRKIKVNKESARKSSDSVNKSDSDKVKASKVKEIRKSNQLKMDKTRQHRVTVHALRKKYQEQKMAKLRAVAFSKISEHSVRSTRSGSSSTTTTLNNQNQIATNKPRAATKTATTMATATVVDKKQPEPKKQIQKSQKTITSTSNSNNDLKTKILRNRAASFKPIRPKIAIVAKRQMSLRSGNNNSANITTSGSRNIIKPRKFAIPIPLRSKKIVKKSQPQKDVASSNNKITKKIANEDGCAKKTIVKNNTEIVEDKKPKNTKIVKENEKSAMKIVTDDKVESKNDQDENSEFSSDDDKPLLKATGDKNSSKKQRKSKINKDVPAKKSKIDDGKIEKADLKKDISVDTISVNDNSKIKTKDESIKITRGVNKTTKSKLNIGKKSGTKNEVKSEVKITDTVTVQSNDESDASKCGGGHRVSRPSRKTKEAATLYMELLGQRLNESNNADEDDLSMDSFPELPNVRKTELLEMELKAQIKNDVKISDKSYSDSSTVKNDVKVKKSSLRDNVLKKTVESKDLKETEDEKMVLDFVPKDYDTSSETPSESESNLSLYETNKVKIDKNSSRCKLRSDRSKTMADNSNSKLETKRKKKVTTSIKNEKSFSDSDEEPLALKISSKGRSDTDVNPKSSTMSEKSSVLKTETDVKLNLKDFVNDKKNAESTPIKSEISGITNPVPNLEESQKIFGIAKRIDFLDNIEENKMKFGKCKETIPKPNKSPTKLEKEIKSLSRGRLLLDTDCPTHPKDLNIFNSPPNELQSPKELRNKRRVNMSAEEIEKWLNESCFEPEAIEDDMIISDIDLKNYTEKKNKFFDKDSPSKNTKPEVTVETELKIPQNESGPNKPGERKTIFNQRRNSNKQTPILTNNKNIQQSPSKNKQAFSPENETSVYSFNLEEHPTPFSTPYRPAFVETTPKTKRKSDTKKVIDKIKKPRKTALNKNLSKTTHAETSTNTTNTKISENFENTEQSKSSIAVQCDFQNEQSTTITTTTKITLPQPNLTDFRNMEISTQTEDASLANEGHLFYIPLQNSKSGDNISEQLIQGVAVKLGTEGPDGPNQRVIMRAKLVTKAQINANQLGDSTVSVDEALMKNILGGKLCDLKNRRLNNASVPIGTVQPLARLNLTEETKSNEKNVSTSSKGVGVGGGGGGGGGGQQFRSYLKHSMVDQKNDANVKNTNLGNISGSPSKTTESPAGTEMMEAPTFYPSEKQFLDPISFIEQITPIAAKYGLCRIVPPSSFKPECKVADDMRFTAYNQYVNRMMYRFGPSVQEMLAIKKYLATQSITLTHAPFIGGMEIDLPRLYHTVQELGGLKEVIEKKKWQRVAEEMCIPKQTQGSANKLDDIYCKYLLPYDTLSPAERQNLLTEVKNEWSRKEKQYRLKQQEKYNDHDKQEYESNSKLNQQQSQTQTQNTSDKESDSESSSGNSDSESDRDLRECTLKGRNMALSQFFRIARNTMSVWFKNSQPDAKEVESLYWEHVSRRDRHVCVHVGSIDSSGCGYGFPAKNSPVAKHPWNLKVLTNNSGSVLRSLGPVMGVTVPTLHVGMLFSACCWYRDPHGLPWIEYLHTGANKIWYGIPARASTVFRDALSSLAPQSVLPQTIWLPSDSAMVPPGELLSRRVPLARTVQRPGEFILVCPKAYTSSLCTGYAVSESVYYATRDWLDGAEGDFKDIQDSREPTMFSLEQLLISIARDPRAREPRVLQSIRGPLRALVERERGQRGALGGLGVGTPGRRSGGGGGGGEGGLEGDNECDVCRTNLFVSMVTHKEEDTTLCLQHAIKHLSNLNRRHKPKVSEKTNSDWLLMYSYTIDELERLFEKVNEKLDDKSSDKGTPAPVMNKRVKKKDK